MPGMNALPPIPPLDAKAVKVLVRAIRVLRYDHPSLSEDELAEEFAEQQRWLAKDGRDNPFIEWLDSGTWRSGFQRAMALADRADEQKARARAGRQRAKEWRQDRQPATSAQLRYVTRLAKRNGEEEAKAPEGLSKLGASRLIQNYLDHAPPTP